MGYVCNKPEIEGGSQWEKGMTLEFSGDRDSRNGAIRNLREMMIGNQGRIRASHRGVGCLRAG